jgi:hypothetical protein
MRIRRRIIHYLVWAGLFCLPLSSKAKSIQRRKKKQTHISSINAFEPHRHQRERFIYCIAEPLFIFIHLISSIEHNPYLYMPIQTFKHPHSESTQSRKTKHSTISPFAGRFPQIKSQMLLPVPSHSIFPLRFIANPAGRAMTNPLQPPTRTKGRKEDRL